MVFGKQIILWPMPIGLILFFTRLLSMCRFPSCRYTLSLSQRARVYCKAAQAKAALAHVYNLIIEIIMLRAIKVQYLVYKILKKTGGIFLKQMLLPLVKNTLTGAVSN